MLSLVVSSNCHQAAKYKAPPIGFAKGLILAPRMVGDIDRSRKKARKTSAAQLAQKLCKRPRDTE